MLRIKLVQLFLKNTNLKHCTALPDYIHHEFQVGHCNLHCVCCIYVILYEGPQDTWIINLRRFKKVAHVPKKKYNHNNMSLEIQLVDGMWMETVIEKMVWHDVIII